MSIDFDNELPICTLCGSDQTEILFRARDFLYGDSSFHYIFHCMKCDVMFLWPIPDDLGEYYPDDYGPYQESDAKLGYRPGMKWGLRKKVALLEDISMPGPLLDIGCAAGHFLNITKMGSKRISLGTDISFVALSHARHTLDLSVWRGDAVSLPLASDSIAVITMWHVLEHLVDPIGVLRELKRVLRPKGVLILACPMADSLESRLFGHYWAGYDVPRHLFAYTRSSLREVLSSIGLDAVESKGVVLGYSSAKISSIIWLRNWIWLKRHPRILDFLSVILGGVIACCLYLCMVIFDVGNSVGVFRVYNSSS
jgi:SAM-dependent methyltransferase